MKMNNALINMPEREYQLISHDHLNKSFIYSTNEERIF